MYTDAIHTLSEQAAAKLTEQRRSLVGHLVRSALAGMYVGACIVLIFTIGGLLSRDSPGVVRLAMGVCFGGALTIVIFAGSELFTGGNLVLTLGVLTRKATLRQTLTRRTNFEGRVQFLNAFNRANFFVGSIASVNSPLRTISGAATDFGETRAAYRDP